MNNEFNLKYPKGISSTTKAFISDVIDKLRGSGDLENVDSASLLMLAENYEMFLKVSQELKSSGLTFTSDRGNISLNPLVKIWKDSQILCQSIMDSYGLTVKSRRKLDKDSDNDSDSPLTQFLNEN